MLTRFAVAVLSLALLAVALPAASGAAPPSASEAVTVPSGAPDRIMGGEVVETCGWPAVVAVESPQMTCTASLVHPSLLITAAHCGDLALAHFGERWQSPKRTLPISGCHRNPLWSSGGDRGNDYQYCLLSQPVNDVPIVPILMGCENEVLRSGREVVAVGFGRTQEEINDYGTKREITWTLASVDWERGTAWASDAGGKSTCLGDSGGPLYVRLGESLGADDTWRVFGINSWTQGGCQNGTGFVLMHQAVPWIEQHSGIDITPCGESDGTWQPSPGCGFFALQPGTGVGSWPACETGPVAGPSTICGPPFAGEDDVAPSVDVLDPEDGSRIEPDQGAADLTIRVSADDGDGWGIDEVYLVIDGVPSLSSAKRIPPFEWSASFPVGAYVLEAVAVDRGGNEGRATSRFGVGQDPPPADTESGGSEDSSDGGTTTSAGPGGSNEEPGDGSTPPGTPEDRRSSGCDCASSRREGGSLGLVLWLFPLALARRQSSHDPEANP